MSRTQNTMLLMRVGVVLLGLASVLHLFEHWETVALENCLAHIEHSHASSGSDSDDPSHTGHHHGCSGHEHSPAILQSSLHFLPHPIVLAAIEEHAKAPPVVHRKIDRPPRLS